MGEKISHDLSCVCKERKKNRLASNILEHLGQTSGLLEALQQLGAVLHTEWLFKLFLSLFLLLLSAKRVRASDSYHCGL